MSHAVQSQGSAYRKGCPWDVLSPHLPAWLALLGPLKAGSKLPPPGRLRHASLICGQLATALSWLPVFSCFCASCPYLQTLSECVGRTLFFPALPSGRQRAPSQKGERKEANPLVWIQALGSRPVCVK